MLELVTSVIKGILYSYLVNSFRDLVVDLLNYFKSLLSDLSSHFSSILNGILGLLLYILDCLVDGFLDFLSGFFYLLSPRFAYVSVCILKIIWK